jgi:hypothetical protein
MLHLGIISPSGGEPCNGLDRAYRTPPLDLVDTRQIARGGGFGGNDHVDPFGMRWGRSHMRLLGLLMCIAALPSAAHAGSGRYDPSTGTWNIIVSLSWEASPSELADIEARFTSASELLHDVTDGAMRFGTVTIFDGGVGKEFADVDITQGAGGASAPSGPGVFGVSFHLFTDDDIYPQAGSPEADTWQTIVHEFGHYALNVKDEYSGSGTSAECVVPTPATACIMDNYKAPAYQDASELCWSGNHDPDADTHQESIHGQSCWDRLDDLYPLITAPGAGPTEAAPGGFVAPVFEYFDDPLVREVSRIEDLETFASQFIDVMGLGDVELGIVTYASTATTVQGATLLDDAGDVVTSKGNLPGIASGQTSIGRGMIAGRDLLMASVAPGPLVMILMTDGFHNHPPGDASLEPLAIVPSLVAEDIRVHTIGLGDSTNEGLLRQIADESGAMFWRANNSFELEPILSSLGAVVRGGSLLDSPQQHSLNPGEVHVSKGWPDDDAPTNKSVGLAALGVVKGSKFNQVLRPVWVEKDNQEATFNLGWSSESAALQLILKTPSGKLITPEAASTGSIPGVRLATGQRYASYIVDNAEEGWWHLAVVARTNSGGTTYAMQPTVLNLRVTGYADGELVTRGGSPAIRVVGMARYGIGVTNASVSALLTDPAGGTHFVAMFDDGDPSHGDDIAADGLYSALVTNLAASGNGNYHFDVTFDVDPATATVVPGEEPPPTVDNRTIYAVRRFHRSFPVDVRVGAFAGGNPGDTDGDGISDSQDGSHDADGDGSSNDRDPDSDGDDHSDRAEGTTDLDCDRVPNFLDWDSDGDGLEDDRDPDPFQDTGCGRDGVDRCICWWGLILGVLIGVLAALLICCWLRRRKALA